MFFRALGRAATRAVPQLTVRSMRPAAMRAPLLATNMLRIQAAPRFVAPFSSSARRSEDSELVLKLAHEISIEADATAPELTDSIDKYLKKSEFELIDTAGEEEVVLQKTTDGETIRVSFSIAPIPPNETDAEHDDAYPDEDLEQLNARSEQTRGADETLDGEALDEAETSTGAAFPARVNITVTKADRPGALLIEAVAQDQEILVDNMYYFSEAEWAEPKSFDAEWKRRGVYAGPPFDQLDAEVQSLTEQYLQQRGVNEEMATFISNYVDFKEQNEYVRWLKNLKAFHE